MATAKHELSRVTTEAPCAPPQRTSRRGPGRLCAVSDDDYLHEFSDAELHRARLAVCDASVDTDDAHLLLQMLGLA